MKQTHIELLTHASALLHQTGDLLREFVLDAQRDEPDQSYEPTQEETDKFGDYFPAAVVAAEKEMQISEQGQVPLSRHDMLELLRRLYFRGYHAEAMMAQRDRNAQMSAAAEGVAKAVNKAAEKPIGAEEVETTEYTYDDAGRVSKATKTLRQYYG